MGEVFALFASAVEPNLAVCLCLGVSVWCMSAVHMSVGVYECGVLACVCLVCVCVYVCIHTCVYTRACVLHGAFVEIRE